MSKIHPCIWFKDEAEEAAKHYSAIFPNSKIDRVYISPIDTPGNKAGDVLLVDFTIGGQKAQALNGGQHFPHSYAISLVFECQDQAELDRVWDALIAGGGAPEQCGWLKDRYGMSWQIVPKGMDHYLSGEDPAASARAFGAVMEMVKLDLATIDKAFRGA